ncbi:MAG: hypothetical protein V4671_18685 [Armatimonadota bacterium]
MAQAHDGDQEHQDEEFEELYVTRDEARQIAGLEALRYLEESDNRIAYVSFVSDLQDYCLCEFRHHPPQGWSFSCRMLHPELRLPGEQISDALIAERARSGNMIAAIRLYRGKYDVGLAEAKIAVERLLKTPRNGTHNP